MCFEYIVWLVSDIAMMINKNPSKCFMSTFSEIVIVLMGNEVMMGDSPISHVIFYCVFFTKA